MSATRTGRSGSSRFPHAAMIISAVVASTAALALAGGTPDDKGGARVARREDAKIELGRRLFFDPAASRAGMRSCADCHQPGHGFSDPAKISHDDRGPTRRHSQTLIDGADNPSAQWDGQFRDVMELVTARITMSTKKGGSGHGVGSDSSVLPQPDSPGSSPAAPGGTSPKPASGEPEAAAPADPADAPPPPPPPTSSGGEKFKKPASSTPPGERSPDEPADAPAASGTPTTPGTPPPAPATSGAAPAPLAKDGGGGPIAPTGKDPVPTKKTDADYLEEDAAKDGDPLPEFVSSRLDITRLPLTSKTLEDSGRYAEAFEAAFGSTSITIARIASAIAAYCHSIRSTDSPYDRFAAGDKTALTVSAQRGLELFRGKAGCASCHVMTGPRAAFTDYEFHDTGVAWRSVGGGYSVDRLDETGDQGRALQTSRPRDHRAFKTPTLRDVARRAPYMHDGSLATLAAVVRHYATVTAAATPACPNCNDPMLDARLKEFSPTNEEVGDLVAFLRSLTGATRAGLAATAWSDRAAKTRLKFVDANGRPLAGWDVTLAAAGDQLPGLVLGLGGWGSAIALTTGEDGTVEFAPPLTTHVRIVPPYGIRPTGGTLVPDTCRDAVVTLPINGRTTVRVTLPRGIAAPDVLVGEHSASSFFPDRRVPKTVFHLEDLVPGVEGRSIATYAAPFRTDVPAGFEVRLPIRAWGMDRLRVIADKDRVVSIDLAR